MWTTRILNGCTIIKELLWLPVFWETQCFPILTTEPDPGVNKPECHCSRIQDHLSLGALLVFFLQQLQTSVQLHNLDDHMNTKRCVIHYKSVCTLRMLGIVT